MDARQAFYDTSAFPFVQELERNWHAIRAELDRLEPAAFRQWPERELYQDDAWKVFGLRLLGKDVGRNATRFPRTAEILRQVPGLMTAGFSALEPGGHILPHVGYTPKVLRCHLGLVVPKDCTLRVGSETRAWQEGRCLIFDDTLEHEAWNRGSSTRIVLLLDFRKP
jgi:beta-hydroxylase